MRTALGSTSALAMRACFSSFLCLFVALAVMVISITDADARRRKKSANNKYAAYVIDANTGRVLFSRNGTARRYPASLTKMMTLYLVFEDLERGKISKSTRIRMSRNAAKRPPSKLGIRPGKTITVQNAILSLVTKSANDVSTAIAEHLSGSEAAFARRMTQKARQLGMTGTQFRNANGLTARGQYTTAADMARLGIALREHYPREFKYFNTRSFRYGRRNYSNHNRLLGRVRGVNGIKTGYTRASGFNLVTSVVHRGCRMVAVVMGGRSGKSRNAHMASLIRQNMGKAKCGSGKMLIAKRRSAPVAAAKPVAVAQVNLPQSAPTPSYSPNLRAKIANRVATAHQVASVKPSDVKRVRNQLAGRNKPTSDDAASRELTTASVPDVKREAEPGWQIQISAAQTPEKARAMLQEARARSSSVLRSRHAYTQQILHKGVHLYRARFAGFSSKKQARAACKALKRKRFNCIALHG